MVACRWHRLFLLHIFRVSIVEFIVGNTVEFMNVTMNMTMNPTNSDKVSEYKKKKKVLTPNQN